jgi:hypothetical protein
MTSPADDASELNTVAVAQPAIEPLGRGRPSRLNQALAWVGIVAGGLFIVAAIFFSGFFVSSTTADHHGGPGKMDCCSQMKPGDHMAQDAMAGPGNPMTPGQMMPGMTMGPGGMVARSPQPAAPTPPNPSRPSR